MSKGEKTPREIFTELVSRCIADYMRARAEAKANPTWLESDKPNKYMDHLFLKLEENISQALDELAECFPHLNEHGGVALYTGDFIRKRLKGE